MFVADDVDDADYAVLIYHSHLRLDAVELAFVDGQIVIGAVDAVVDDRSYPEVILAQRLDGGHRVGVIFLVEELQLFAERYRFGLETSVSELKLLVDFPEVEIRRDVVSRVVDRRRHFPGRAHEHMVVVGVFVEEEDATDNHVESEHNPRAVA